MELSVQTAWIQRAFACLALAFWLARADGAEIRHVTLKLSYYHQFQFAGYYAADMRGLYRKEGLDVRIDELVPGNEPFEDIVQGRTEFAVSNNRIFGEWAAGRDLFLIAIIYQTNQRVLIVRDDSPYKTLQDLVGLPKEHLVGPAYSQEADLWTALKSIGQEPSTFFLRSKGPEDFDRFVRGDLWVLPGHLSNEPLRLRRAGIATRTLDVSDRKSIFPGDGLTCSGELWRTDPRLVERFRSASLDGWAYALRHPDEVVDHILRERRSPYQTQDRVHLLQEAKVIQDLIDPDRFPIGHVNPERLQSIARLMRASGLAARVPEDQFYRPTEVARLWYSWLGGSLAAVGAGLIALLWLNRRQQRHLAESRTHYHNLVDLAEGYCAFRMHVGADGILRLEQASRSVANIFGHSLAHYRQDLRRLIGQILPEDRDDLLKAWRSLDPKTVQTMRYRFRVRHPVHERPRHLMVHAVLSRTLAGLDFDGICLDLTAEAELEEQRRDLHHQLQLAQRNESLGLLASGIAHDFNNILGAIRGNAELLTPLVRTDDNGQRRLMRLLQGVDRATGLVRQILAYTGRGSIESKPLDLGEETRQLGELLKHTLPPSVTIALEVPPGLPIVHFDPAQFQQVLVNLIMNAAESYEGRPGVVKVALSATDPERVQLCVSDEGCGMDKEVQSHLFQPYFTTKPTGHGLGLAAVQGIVRQASGTISCRSASGTGTTFTLDFPAGGKPSKPRADTPSTTVTLAARLVLVVDDDEMMRELTGEMLAELGFACETAAGGEECRRLLATRRKDFVAMILDCRMPDVDGVTILRELRAANDRLPTILVSGMTSGEDLSRELDDPRTRFMAKPFTKATLQSLLDSLLRTRRTTTAATASESSYSIMVLNAAQKPRDT
jgi:two-component system, cell cycle sensor histidine kinase and response regulator CckA